MRPFHRISNSRCAVEANVRWTMRQVLESREGEGKARTASREYKLVGAIYDIASGRVRFSGVRLSAIYGTVPPGQGRVERGVVVPS